ncbi:MAG TPA: deoxyguanosinetriphosphate triphosphohydrolase, partial [Planctomycetaceae bacterium]|nr:deoxyguanosinetriphosphate triphosphohydrolase [Planctomycetaceae bacterium]
PELLPSTAQAYLDDDHVMRVVCDYLAGMTDRHALDEHRNR